MAFALAAAEADGYITEGWVIEGAVLHGSVRERRCSGFDINLWMSHGNAIT